MTRHVALLRAVNVGGRGKIAMADLRKLAEAIGFSGVATVLQSGSLTFAAEGKQSELEGRLEAALQDKLRLRTEVMIRSADQWRNAGVDNPYLAAAKTDPSHLVLLAGKGAMKQSAEAAVRAAIKGREQISISASDAMAYVLYPDGIGRSKLTNAVLERHLGTAVTGRNWNTVLKIADLLGLAPGLSASAN